MVNIKFSKTYRFHEVSPGELVEHFGKTYFKIIPRSTGENVYNIAMNEFSKMPDNSLVEVPHNRVEGVKFISLKPREFFTMDGEKVLIKVNDFFAMNLEDMEYIPIVSGNSVVFPLDLEVVAKLRK